MISISRVTFTQPASATCLPMSLLRSELQSCVRYMRCPRVPRHSERSEESRKRLATIGFGERRLPACRGRQLADHWKERCKTLRHGTFKGFSASCQKEQASSLCSPETCAI